MQGANTDPARHMVGFTSDDIRADWKRLMFVEDPKHYNNVPVATSRIRTPTCCSSYSATDSNSFARTPLIPRRDRVFGTRSDVTLEEIALGMLYPADAFTDKTIRQRRGLTEVIRRPPVRFASSVRLSG